MNYATKEDWYKSALQCIRRWKTKEAKSADEIRFRVLDKVGSPPSRSKNTGLWAGLIRKAQTQDLLKFTGEFTRSSDPVSHGRIVRMYELT